MALQTQSIQLPTSLLLRARVSARNDVRELVTLLLENYIQDLEQTQLRQSYELYYANLSPEEIAEESEVMQDFACSDAELDRRSDV